MAYNFDQIIDRQNTHSTKWQKFAPDVLPLWVADMDFAAPEFILDGLRTRLEHPILGYTDKPESLTTAFQDWLVYHFDWQIPQEWIVWVPGVVPALNLAARCTNGGGLMIPTPVYHPFLDLALNASVDEVRVPLITGTSAQTGAHGQVWEMDFDAMQQALKPDTRMLMICNPQNPTGRCYTPNELADLANFVEKNDLLLVSDEIHANIILDPASTHVPIAQAQPEIEARTIHLYAATKIYNIPGLSCAAAVIADAKLRQQFLSARAGLQPGLGPLEMIASELAYQDRSDWIPELLAYLRENLSLIKDTLGTRLSPLQATYLAWIDVGDLGLTNTEAHFAQHGLGLSPGAQFGQPSHVRLNFGCPRGRLREALERFKQALESA